MKACLWQIFTRRCQFRDLPVCSWQCADINGRACLVTSPISPETQRQRPNEESNMSWQSTETITLSFKQWQATDPVTRGIWQQPEATKFLRANFCSTHAILCNPAQYFWKKYFYRKDRDVNNLICDDKYKHVTYYEVFFSTDISKQRQYLLTLPSLWLQCQLCAVAYTQKTKITFLSYNWFKSSRRKTFDAFPKRKSWCQHHQRISSTFVQPFSFFLLLGLKNSSCSLGESGKLICVKTLFENHWPT